MSFLGQTLSISIKLIPFALAIVIYFTGFVPYHGQALTAFVKCLPIACLIIFVGLQSLTLDERGMWYAIIIIVGLICCGIGDGLPNLFEVGVLAFAVGHIFYMIGFGFAPRAWILGAIMYACATGCLIYMGPSLEGAEIGTVPVYAYIVISMVWRAWARLIEKFLAVFIRLVPFILATITYFVELVPREQSAAAAFIKCLPIICLMVFVGLHCMDMDEVGQWYARVIIIGLIFCGIGDALLIWPHLFEVGVLAFAIGHVCYMIAFGFQPRAWILGVIAFALATGALIYLGPSLTGIELGGVPVYAYIIFTMVWRACARLTERQAWSWSKLITAIGALMFATSDLLLALNRYKIDLKYGGALVMSTYYGAQLLISLSVIEPRPPTKEISIGSRKMWCV